MKTRTQFKRILVVVALTALTPIAALSQSKTPVINQGQQVSLLAPDKTNKAQDPKTQAIIDALKAKKPLTGSEETIEYLEHKKIDAYKKSARGGTGVDGGGGDLCENRIKIIRDDIEKWILNKGHKKLLLPNNLTSDQYSINMRYWISTAKIQCVGEGDDHYPVQISNTSKVCIFSKSNSSITCDREQFMKMDEADQYVLTHHEFAGLAGIEVPHGADSNYVVSNQISKHLSNQVVKKLAVLPDLKTGNPVVDRIQDEFRKAHFPSEAELRIGKEIQGCRIFELMYTSNEYSLNPIIFSRWNGLIRRQIRPKSETYFGPSTSGLARTFTVGSSQYYEEIRATSNGDLIIERAVLFENLDGNSIAKPKYRAFDYTVCLHE